MKAALLLTAWLGAAPAPTSTVVVREHETLDEVAARALDGGSASELKALNQLTSDSVPAGTPLKVPGADRQTALKALEISRTAVQGTQDEARRSQAEARLKDAEAHFQRARYSEAIRMADEVWALLNPPQPSNFTVEVGGDGGSTTIINRQGPPVTVEAKNTSRAVTQGERVLVRQGTSVPEPPEAPEPSQPADNRRLAFRPEQGLLGPVTLAWAAVEGADEYEVEVLAEPALRRGGAPVVKQAVTALQLVLPGLPAGRYRWTVRALSPARGRSGPSVARHFELAANTLELNVKVKQGWQK
ncbi:peptidoglycan-binding protein LysM [Myxococcaceae bacterium JPH2]|nr:peptidoglycan-binding protein LysM [Myxococcaceae bacterium JPH2]